MIKVQINSAEMPGKGIDARWIEEQVRNRRSAGQSICARVTIEDPRVSFSLATPGCGAGGFTRDWTDLEKRIIELWTNHGMDKPDFNTGNLTSFLKVLITIL
jgi:hypothetical protein